MLMGFLAFCMLAAVPLVGGSWNRLLAMPVRAVWLLPPTLVLQVLVISIVPAAPPPLPVLVHLLTYCLAALFLWCNRRLPGLPFLAAGALMNCVAIAANGGTLPASAAALQRAGWSATVSGFTNSSVLHSPRLAWLGDNFAVPQGIPFANVFSLGDIFILLGALVMIYSGSRTSWVTSTGDQSSISAAGPDATA